MTEHKNLAEALAAVQADLPKVRKSAQGQVPGNRTYAYADLADVTAAILPKLAEHGLSWMACPDYNTAGQFVLRYELLHTSEQSRRGEYPLPEGDPQKIGSALTYGRRYCLCSVTGVVADEDDDGQAASGSLPEPRKQQRQPVAQKPQQTEDTVAAARVVLANRAKAAKIPIETVAAEYLSRTQTDITKETDPKPVRAFIAAWDKGQIEFPTAEAASKS